MDLSNSHLTPGRTVSVFPLYRLRVAVDTYNPSTLELREANHMFNADLDYIVGPVEGRKEGRREGGQRR